MNKLLSNAVNGLEFNWEAFRFEQDAVREAFYGLVSALGIGADEGFILSGCEVSDGGTDWDIAAGYMCLAGEIYKVDAHSVTKTLGGGQNHAWAAVLTYDPDGNQPMETGGVFDTYAVRKANVVVSSAGTYTPMLCDNIIERLAALAVDETPPSLVALTYQNSAEASATEGEEPGVRVLPNGMVQLEGAIDTDSVSAASVATIPAGYRPRCIMWGAAMQYDSTASLSFKITTDGVVTINGDHTKVDKIFLSCIPPYYPG